MGRNKVKHPTGISAKLKRIRLKIGVTQTVMYELLYPTKKHLSKNNRAHISAFENGSRTPSLLETLKYVDILERRAQIKISTDDLIDDRRKLPF